MSRSVIDGTLTKEGVLIHLADPAQDDSVASVPWEEGYFGGNPTDPEEGGLGVTLLSFEESLYLLELGRLQIHHLHNSPTDRGGSKHEDSEGKCAVDFKFLWDWTCSQSTCDRQFRLRYSVYRKLRQSNWIVRSGLNYGVDFVLYRLGPGQDHSEYAVFVLDAADYSILWKNIIGINRACSGAKKKLVLAIVSEAIDCKSPREPHMLNENYSIRLIQVGRWIPEEARLERHPDDE